MSAPKEPMTLRDWARAAAASLRIMMRADPWRALGSGLLFTIATPAEVLNAVWIKQLVNAAVAGHMAIVWRSGVLIGAASGFVFVAVILGINIMIPLIENTGVYLDNQLIELSTATANLSHHERPEHADKIELLRLQRGELSSVSAMYIQVGGVVLQAFLALGLLVREDAQLLLLPLFALPTMVATFYAANQTQRSTDQTAEGVRLARHLFELGTTAGPAKEIRIFGLAGRLIGRHRQTWSGVQAVQDLAAVKATLASSAAWLVFGTGYGYALLLVVHKAIAGTATVGDVVLVIGLAATMNQMVIGVIGILAGIAQSLQIAHRFVWLSDLHHGEAKAEAARVNRAPDRLEAGIFIEDLSFSYPGMDDPVLRDVNLVIPAGSTVALVGDNGAGKSTLVKLLTAMYEPSAGRILVDGVDLASIRRDDWRSRITAAFQDYAKLELVARESVGLGRFEQVTDGDAVHAALDRAHATDVLVAMPEGLETQLGRAYSDGVELSGGQWQKLALGRAMMRSAPLLMVLDEPTAALDAETEHELFVQYAAAAAGAAVRTGGVTILVSHRFSTVRMADLIVVISAGTVAEMGSHRELMARGGAYAELYEMQARGYR